MGGKAHLAASRGAWALPTVTMEDRRAAVEQMGFSVETYLRKAAWGHILAGDFYSKVNFASGLPAAILAGLAGVSALADFKLLAGTVAIGVAILTGVTTFLHPAETAQQHARVAETLLKLADECRNITVEGPATGSDRALKDLQTRIFDLQRQGRDIAGVPWVAPRFRRRVLGKRAL
jgi:hypothetical protein